MKASEINNRFLSTETIPIEVYQNLPALLAEPCTKFQLQRHKDVYLTASLGVISSCLPGVSGKYHTQRYYPHMYMVVVAPPASGKGTAGFARKLAMPLHEARKQASPQNEEGFAFSNVQLEHRKWGIFIAANTSASRFLHQLSENEGEVMMFESEIDTLTNSISQEWGNFSSSLREAFHHERIMLSRLTDDVNIDIQVPKIAMVLTGTPDQIQKLLPSVNNGLFSRNVFYAYKQEMGRIDVRPPASGEDLDAYFLAKGEEVKQMAAFLEAYPAEFKLSEEQWDAFNDFLNYTIDGSNISHGDDAHSSSLRLGISMFRIAMILSALRKWENKDKGTELYCASVDFQTARMLAKVYMGHTLTMLEILPNTGVIEHLKVKDKFFQQLPDVFTRAEALVCGRSLKFSVPSLDRYLKHFIDIGKLLRGEYGQYRKAQVT